MCRRLRRTERAPYEQGILYFSVEKGTKIINLEQDFFTNHRIVSPVKRVDFVSDRVSYTQGERKVFPDYKHLLQENYVEYKHIFLPLLKLVSKMLCHVFIVMLQLHNLLVSKWRQ